MCPICITTAALIAGGAASARKLTEAAKRKTGEKHDVDKRPTLTQPEEDLTDIQHLN